MSESSREIELWLTYRKLKRQHSVEPDTPSSRRSPGSLGASAPEDTATKASSFIPSPYLMTSGLFGVPDTQDPFPVGSPLKKQRASLGGANDEALLQRMSMSGDVVKTADANQNLDGGVSITEPAVKANNEEEEL